jgi:hypothetical protein
MDESKRYVVEDYPVQNLPEDLRGSIDFSHRARIIIEDLGKPRDMETFEELRKRIMPRGITTVEGAAARVRALRDEWDA